MKARIIQMIIAVVMALLLAAPCFAAITETIDVKANIPLQNGLMDIVISRIVPADPFGPTPGKDDWTPFQPSIDFGTLEFSNQYQIWMGTCYYAVDIGIFDNSGKNWRITHTTSSVALIPNRWTLDNNINVVFMRQKDDTHADELSKMSFSHSNGQVYDANTLGDGWLRIYYGIANGKTDASGVGVITGMWRPGDYKGTVTITLSR